MAAPLFESLDFIYSPSADPAQELAQFEKLPGARVVFAIEAMDTRVAMLELSPGPPHVLLAGHLPGERPVLVFRVRKLASALRTLRKEGWPEGQELELPMGPACVFTLEGGHRIALYEAVRPGAVEHFAGRRDF